MYMYTSGPASAQESSEVKRTTASAGSSSEVGTTVVISLSLVFCVWACVQGGGQHEQPKAAGDSEKKNPMLLPKRICLGMVFLSYFIFSFLLFLFFLL